MTFDSRHEEFIRRFRNHVRSSLGRDLICSICDSDHFEIEVDYHLLQTNKEGYAIGRKLQKEIFVLTCTHCGFMYNFSNVKD